MVIILPRLSVLEVLLVCSGRVVTPISAGQTNI